MSYDIIIKNGLYFDGSGTPGAVRHVGIRDGRIDVVREFGYEDFRNRMS